MYSMIYFYYNAQILPIILVLNLDEVHITMEVTRLHIEDTTPGYLIVDSS